MHRRVRYEAQIVPRTYDEKARDTISVFDFMTSAQVAAVKSYALTTDVTLPVQRAMDAAWARKADLSCWRTRTRR